MKLHVILTILILAHDFSLKSAVVPIGSPDVVLPDLHDKRIIEALLDVGDSSRAVRCVKSDDQSLMNGPITILFPLMEASIEGNSDKVSKLISEGVDVNQVDDKDNTALHWAVAHDHTSIVKQLISARADFNKQNSDGLTPFALAVDEENKEIVALLLSARANLNTQDCNLFRVLNIPTNKLGIKELKGWLSKHKISIDIDKTGYTPLMRAVIRNNEDITELLLSAKAHIYTKAVILDKDINSGRVLLAKGKKPLRTDVFDLVQKHGNENIKKWLDQKEKTLKPLHVLLLKMLMKAIKTGNRKEIKTFINKNADVDIPPAYIYMLNEVSDWNIHEGNFYIGKIEEVVRMLLSVDADVNATGINGDWGDTPLIHVCGRVANYSKKEAELLLLLRANPNGANKKDGITPLHLASAGGKSDIVKLLLDAKADATIASNSGEGLLDCEHWPRGGLHLSWGQEKCKKLLKAAGAKTVERKNVNQTGCVIA